MPTAAMLRNADGDFKSIVAGVINMAPEVEPQREEFIAEPSIIRAEFTRELEDLDVLKGKFKDNITKANFKQKEKMKKMQKKYDKEGTQFVEDES